MGGELLMASTSKFRIGTMLIAEGTELPKSATVGTESCAAGWSLIINSTSAELDKKIESAGWTFFYMAGEIQARGFGLNERVRTDRAMTRVMDAVKREGCNCLEITQVRQRSFLGLRYTSLVVHSRHIQQSRSFHHLDTVPVGRRSNPSEWLSSETPQSERPAA